MFIINLCSHPAVFLSVSLMVTVICGLGLISFYEESDMTALWVPVGSQLRNNVEWVQQNFPQQFRSHSNLDFLALLDGGVQV